MVGLNSVVLRESIYVSVILLRVPFTLVSSPNIPLMHLYMYTDACSILMLVLPTLGLLTSLGTISKRLIFPILDHLSQPSRVRLPRKASAYWL